MKLIFLDNNPTPIKKTHTPYQCKYLLVTQSPVCVDSAAVCPLLSVHNVHHTAPPRVSDRHSIHHVMLI